MKKQLFVAILCGAGCSSSQGPFDADHNSGAGTGGSGGGGTGASGGGGTGGGRAPGMRGGAGGNAGGGGSGAPLTGVASISAGYAHACALLTDGSVRCWGYLGDPSNTDSAVPVAVAGLTDVIAISTGYLHTCALLAAGTVRCWGTNGSGQLGNDSTATDSVVHLPVAGLQGVTAISAGSNQTCAILVGGTVACWGDNRKGELGNGTTTSSPVPVLVSGLSDATAISTSWGWGCASSSDGSTVSIECWPVSHSCVLLADGTVRCWGLNADGQLGNGTTTETLVPVQVSGLSGVRAIAAGGGQTCALLTGGTVQCWGYNGNGQLGNGATAESTVPVPVAALTGTAAISAGYAHACAVMTDGTVRCWGANDYRVRCFFGCGLENLAPDSLVPVPVSGLAGVAAISAGEGFTCARLTDGTVQCWGRGPLGNGWTTDSPVPLPVAAATN